MGKMLLVVLVWLNVFLFASGDENDVHVRYLRIKSDIQTRFATTLVTSRLANPSSEAKEISFTAQLPDAAFISNFSMQIGDKIIVGDVKEKEQAKQAYERARSRGESAGLVAQNPRETNAFTISANVAANDKVTFNLTYQEILKRVHGAYKHIINLQSDKLQQSTEVEIDVQIMEQGKIVNVSVPKFGAKIGEKTNSELLTAEQETNAHITTVNAGSISTTQIVYKPKSEQIQASNGTLNGQLVVLYDVQRDRSGGEIQVVNGYFVHFFAPQGLTKGEKHVVFVLDKSGSMIGQKFKQTQIAMKRILRDLNPDDIFNIIMFSTEYRRWKPLSVRANEVNVQEAIDYVTSSVADHSTNIYDPLADAIQILNTTQSNPLASMIVFMTDGQPNAGTYTRPDQIVEHVTHLNRDLKYIIHSIAFGHDADFNLIQRISANNFGLARKVYEDLDADAQLTGFYAEISSPLLTEVKIEYLNETVDVRSLIQDQSYNYYDGGEMVVLGKLNDDQPELVTFDASINARSSSGRINLQSQAQSFICPRRPIITADDRVEPCCFYPRCPRPFRPMTTTERPIPGPSTVGGFVERMWAYQTIKKLLKEAELGSGGNATEKKQEALRLSLKYHFVTAMTSMVVVQPDANATALEQVTAEQRRGGSGGSHSARGGASYAYVQPMALYDQDMDAQQGESDTDDEDSSLRSSVAPTVQQTSCNSSVTSDSTCRPSNDSNGALCSGRGVCVCGVCQCNQFLDGLHYNYGRYCECDNYSCPRANGRVCGGNGICLCDQQCRCEPDWTGRDCSCWTLPAFCYTANGVICNGKGHCVCGKCVCSDERFSGRTCEECPTCPTPCVQYRDCVLYKIWGRRTMNKSEFETRCGHNYIIVSELPDTFSNNTSREVCQFVDAVDECTYYFKYWVTEDGNVTLWMRRYKALHPVINRQYQSSRGPPRRPPPIRPDMDAIPAVLPDSVTLAPMVPTYLTTMIPATICDAEILIIFLIDSIDIVPWIKFDRINRLVDILQNSSTGWNLQINSILIKNPNDLNQTYLVTDDWLPWYQLDQREHEGSKIEEEIKEALINATTPDADLIYEPLDENRRKPSGHTWGNRFVLWIGQLHSLETRTEVYKFLVDEKKYISLGRQEQEFQESLAKIRSDTFQKNCTWVID